MCAHDQVRGTVEYMIAQNVYFTPTTELNAGNEMNKHSASFPPWEQ